MLKLTQANRKWWVLAAMISSLSLVFLDQTALVVALPQIQLDLHLSNTMQQWVINAYTLTLASLIILGGKAGDIYGHRRIFLIGIVIFLLFSLTCALAQQPWQLVLSRAFQGVGGALMIPATGVLVVNHFSEQERGHAIGLYVGIASIFLSVGPFIGGLITEYLNWRWVFWLNLPIAVLGFILTAKVVLPSEAKKINHLDWIGALALLITLFSLVIALMEGSYWNLHLILGLILLSILSGLFFWRHEQSIKDPLIDLSIFYNTTFFRCALTLSIMQSVFVVFVFWALFLQNILKLSPMMAGLFTIPVTLPITFMAPIAGHLRDRIGAKPVIITGIIGTIIAVSWVSITAWFHNYLYLLPAFLLLGCSTPMVISSCMATALPAVELSKRGVGSGTINAMRQIGSTLGLALMTFVINSLYHQSLTNLLNEKAALLGQNNIENLLIAARNFIAFDVEIRQFPITQQLVLEHINQQSYILGFSVAMGVLVLMAMIGLWIARKIPIKPRAESLN